MGKQTILEWIKDKFGGFAFKTFLWSVKMSKEQYWKVIYEQEKAFAEPV